MFHVHNYWTKEIIPEVTFSDVIWKFGYNSRIFPLIVTFQHSRFLSTAQTEETHHSIIKDNEKPTGESDKHEFQAETRMLLDIVARSLYSEKEVSSNRSTGVN